MVFPRSESTAANAAQTTAQTTAQTADKGLGGISGMDFMNILLKQLQYQDPFKPMTNEEMAQQIATIRELEVNTQLGTKLGQITNQQQVGSAAAPNTPQVEVICHPLL